MRALRETLNAENRVSVKAHAGITGVKRSGRH